MKNGYYQQELTSHERLYNPLDLVEALTEQQIKTAKIQKLQILKSLEKLEINFLKIASFRKTCLRALVMDRMAPLPSLGGFVM